MVQKVLSKQALDVGWWQEVVLGAPHRIVIFERKGTLTLEKNSYMALDDVDGLRGYTRMTMYAMYWHRATCSLHNAQLNLTWHRAACPEAGEWMKRGFGPIDVNNHSSDLCANLM